MWKFDLEREKWVFAFPDLPKNVLIDMRTLRAPTAKQTETAIRLVKAKHARERGECHCPVCRSNNVSRDE